MTSEEIRWKLLTSEEPSGPDRWVAFNRCMDWVCRLSFMKDISLLLLLVTYSLIGAAIMLEMEISHDQKERAQFAVKTAAYMKELQEMFCKNVTENPAFRTDKLTAEDNCTAVLLNVLDTYEEIKRCRQEFQLPWNFQNALSYVVTVYTTIGYGSIVASTTAGRLFTVLYACFGIPLMFTVLARMGYLFSLLLHYIWAFLRFAICGYAMLQERRLIDIAVQEYEFPLLLPLILTFGWLFFCAAVFQQWETQWDYATAVYYTFTSLSTIGFGDVLPTDTTKILVAFLFIFIGLSLVSMCITVIQLKMEKFFARLMAMIEIRYKMSQAGEKAMEDVDPLKVITHYLDGHREAKWLIALFGKHQRSMLVDEWQARARMKLKSTQTEVSIAEEETQCSTDFMDASCQCFLISSHNYRPLNKLTMPDKELGVRYSDMDDFKQLMREVNVLLTDCRGIISSKEEQPSDEYH